MASEAYAAEQADVTHHETALGVSNPKLGMWVFIGSECLFFGAMISTYLLYVTRTESRGQPGPSPGSTFDIPFTSVSTFILLMSSLAMVLALAAVQTGDMRRFRVWILATALLGGTFLSGQFYEFAIFVDEGMKLETSPFTSSFFMLTSFHGLHVAIGILMLVALWAASMGGRVSRESSEVVENIGLYWHFVDIVWILIFTVIYLIPVG
ncbi:MAG: cytochrome c oxidase subunit 3 [Egibacteraceae bacterium]